MKEKKPKIKGEFRMRNLSVAIKTYMTGTKLIIKCRKCISMYLGYNKESSCHDKLPLH